VNPKADVMLVLGFLMLHAILATSSLVLQTLTQKALPSNVKLILLLGPNMVKWTKKYICPNPNIKYGSFST
jgi:hypothetical protein